MSHAPPPTTPPSSDSFSRGADASGRSETSDYVLHAVCVAVRGYGVLITGPSGTGKSELALGLLDRGHRLVADDAVRLRHGPGGGLLAQCPTRLQGLLEVRGLGIIDLATVLGGEVLCREAAVALEVKLHHPTSGEWAAWNRLDGRWDQHSILGVPVPRLALPVAAGRNTPLLVETALATVLSAAPDRTAEFKQKEL